MKISKYLFVIAITATFNQALAADNDVTFKDWKKSCVSNAEKTKQVCHISQTLTTKAEGKAILNVAVGTLPGNESETIIFTLPLGVGLAPGIAIYIDKGKQQKIKYNICNPKGCVAGMNLTPSMITQLKAGSQIKVSFANAQGKVFTVPVSLKGFTAGFHSL